HGAGQQLVLRGPAEHAFHAADAVVHVVAAPPQGDHVLPHGLQRERAEPGSGGSAVQLAERPEGEPEVVELAAAGTVMDAGEAPVAEQHRVNGQVSPGGRGRGGPPHQPLSDQTVVLGAASGRAVPSEVVVLAGEGDDGEAGRLVEAVAWYAS